jgi:small subunit ribosomal protein S17
MAHERKKTLIGRVISDKMDKTIVVSIDTTARHPLYGKVLTRSKKFKAHDENNTAAVGDVVKIIESRPISKHKRWLLTEIVEKATQ